MKTLSLLTLFVIMTGCQGRDTVVNPHDQKQETAAAQPLNQKSLQFPGLSLESLQDTLRASKRNPTILLNEVITPLEKNIFNVATLQNPEITGGNFYAWLNLYAESLYELYQSNPSPAAQAKLDGFIKLALNGCNANLDNCQLLQIFRLTNYSNRLFVLKANQVGASINACVLEQTKVVCDRLVNEKYRLLAYANLLDVASTRDKEFLTSYLEHANLLMTLNNNSNIHKLASSLFITLFLNLDASLDQCDLVKKFDSWSYSKKSSTNHAEISKKLFSLATACDLYDKKGQLSTSFWKAMKEIQINADPIADPSFYQRLLQIKRNKNEMEAVINLGLGPLFNKATTRTTKGALNSAFYNEYFYVLDRFYTGHILMEDAKQILLGANRDYKLLIQTFDDYMKLQTFIKITDSKQFFKAIIKRNQSVISSEKLFERSVSDSEPLAQEWLKLQDGFNNLFIAVKYVVSKQSNAELATLMRNAEIQFKNLSQSLKIVVTYPSMFMLAHLISEAQGSVAVRTFWGKIEKSATTIYQELWSGQQQPWFRFNDDPAPLNKFYLLYALDYNLKGNFVLIQKDSDLANNSTLKSKFFDVLLNKYIGKIRSELEKKYVDEFRSKRASNPMLASNKSFCNYELDPKVSTAPTLNIAVESLSSHIYSGQNDKTTSNYLMPTINLITSMKGILEHIHSSVKPRIEYARQIIFVAEQNGISSDVLASAKEELQKTENLVKNATDFFASEFKNQKNCFIRMTLVEQFYQYLVVENERSYLAQVHQEMEQSLQNVDNANITKALATLNDQPGRYKDSNKPLSDNARENYFDFFSSRSVFNYSQYDFLMRLAGRLENSQFTNPSAALLQHEEILRRKFPQALRKPLFLDRSWTVLLPPNVKDSVFLKDRKADIPLVWTSDREEFIRQGLSVINKKDKPFTTWLVENNQINNFKLLVESAVYLYAATDATSSHKIDINDVFQTMEEFVNFTSLTPYDVEIFKTLGLESRPPRDEMKDIFLATALKAGSSQPEVLSESLHPFSYLYESFVKILNINNTIFKAPLADVNSMADQPLENAYLFSTILNNDTFKINFKTHEYLVKKLKDEYTAITKHHLHKITEMRKMFSEKKSSKYAESVFRVLDNQLVTFESASSVSLQDDLIHPQKYNNILIFIREFNQSTKDQYGTGELLKALEAK